MVQHEQNYFFFDTKNIFIKNWTNQYVLLIKVLQIKKSAVNSTENRRRWSEANTSMYIKFAKQKTLSVLALIAAGEV